MKILIAEDAEILQSLYRTLMDQWGYEYDLARDGAEAIALALGKPGEYDLCIMDVQMPGVDGLEATRIIRKERSDFPILGYSSDDSFQGPCLDAGMDSFLPKSSSLEQLRSVIEEIAEMSSKKTS